MTKPSILCRLCEGLSYNDEGGYSAQDESGLASLSYEIVDRSRYRPEVFHKRRFSRLIEDAYPNCPLLSKSANGGCDGCKFLKQSACEVISARGYVEARGEMDFELTVAQSWSVGNRDLITRCVISIDIRITLCPRDITETPDMAREGSNTLIVKHYAYSKESDRVQSWLRLPVVPSGSILTPKTVTWIHSRLSCTECGKENALKGFFIPTRLLRVDCYPVVLEEVEKSLAISNREEHIKYAALTYCWGPPEKARFQLKTEKDTIMKRKSGILSVEMPNVLRDAIAVCRTLSIPYLWVDSLCILQDDQTDWQREASRMGQVYSHAYLTICPLSSDSCIEGFLDQHTSTDLTVPFHPSVNPNIHGTFNLTTKGYHYGNYEDVERSLTSEGFRNSVWKKRGWTFQENFMSKKLLTFGNHTCGYRCPHFTLKADGERPCKPDESNTSILETKISLQQLYAEWHVYVVIPYCTRTLSRATDRLPALSGLAREFNKRLRDEYVAGLWRSQLYRGLFWATVLTKSRAQSFEELLDNLMSPTSFIAPSWSWARVGLDEIRFRIPGRPRLHDSPGLHTYYNDQEDTLLYTQECDAIIPQITLASADPFGQLSNAALQITTRICKVPREIVFDTGLDLMADRPRSEHNNESNTPTKIAFALDWGADANGEDLRRVPTEKFKLMLLGSVVPIIDSSDDDWFSDNSGWDSDDGFKEMAAQERDNERRRVYGLIIYQLPGTCNWVRVGVFATARRTIWGAGTQLYQWCEPTTITLV
ncbi:heterokaryon incompatibility protein-domain-containing protein [Xylariaceae sp. FL0255]|nr:heterokaryon incompatibility protein-domain-containing protein [Xylariaceae sp. FL0255]